jgi:hypothetical protein
MMTTTTRLPPPICKISRPDLLFHQNHLDDFSLSFLVGTDRRKSNKNTPSCGYRHPTRSRIRRLPAEVWASSRCGTTAATTMMVIDLLLLSPDGCNDTWDRLLLLC